MTRVLYVDIDLIHLNPTATYFPLLIEAASEDVSFYGPGFSSPEVLKNGLQAWIDETGPYDFIVLGPNTPVLATQLDDQVIWATFNHMRHYAVHQHKDRQQIIEFLKDVFDALPKVEIKYRAISSLNFDYYAASSAQVQRLEDLGLHLIGPNDQFVRPFAELPDFVTKERHYQRKKGKLSDVWYDFLHAHPERVITACHYVVPSEFSSTPLHERRPVIAVPGVEYHLRKKAVSELRTSGVRAASKWYFHLFRVLSRLGVPCYSHHVGLHFYNQAFQHTLKTSRYVFTAPGGFGFPVRKFFEIPAAGALLLCKPCNGYQDLGFRDGVHYLSVEPDNLPAFLKELASSGEGHDIAVAGRKITARNHSIYARAQQIRRCFDALLRGTYRGARWENGSFVVRTGGAA